METKVIYTRVPAKLHRRLTKAARERGVPLSILIRTMLAVALDDLEPEGEK